jgi:ABC transporter DrrB family efflux protein
MTAITVPSTAAPAPSGHRLRWTLADTVTVTWRNLLAYTRIPEALFFSTLQPIMFVLLFRYVFGGAIPIPGGVPYVDYMMPGIFVQTVMFGAVSTSVGLAEDLQKGLIERFRALPMARSAVLAGRTTADALRNVLVVIIMTGVAYAVGFRLGDGVPEYILGALILLAFAYSMSWGFAAIGLAAPNSETAQVMAFPILMPLTFASTAFVPLQSMPGWLQAFARAQPVSVVVDGARSLMVGGYYHSAHSVWFALAWIVGLLVVLVPLGVWKYRQTK